MIVRWLTGDSLQDSYNNWLHSNRTTTIIFTLRLLNNSGPVPATQNEILLLKTQPIALTLRIILIKMVRVALMTTHGYNKYNQTINTNGTFRNAPEYSIDIWNVARKENSAASFQ